ncbi:DUF2333 family protein [Wenzhouxiangella sp. XN24]|uniref:DUF2333 family protein n=1 Tax=Wenzhouxiangella sp. XN24 TaxID=2713569 RepID=UPI0013EC8CB2|nr:DUF2333 family protein [Wenzhouxiangella sp. XN24]NGX17250.1 DUF2333 family protein [Wenzhouxiangella sp. XN24]
MDFKRFAGGGPRPPGQRRRVLTRTAGIVAAVLAVFVLLLGWYWSREPDTFWVDWERNGEPAVTGYATTDTLLRVARTLLDKPGGYLTNDVMPPGLYLDNMPNWEFGVLVQVRDLARVMRNDFSRSQTQSVEDPDLAEAEPNFNFDNNSWILPSSESRYRRGIDHLESYRARLVGEAEPPANFYARADNLREWLAVVEKRLGNLSQQLSASVGQARVNIDLAGDPAGEAGGPRRDEVEVQTPWLQIDDVFYEARGTAWALLHFLRAIEYDMRHVLEDKNATVSLRQVIRELEGSLAPMRSPIVLNGGGYGLFANHSLVMASYLSRANQAITNLRELLAGG